MAYFNSLKCKTFLNFICSILAQLPLTNVQLAYSDDKNVQTNQPTIPEINFNIISQNSSQKITINKEFEKNNAQIFQTFDPNFKHLGPEKWTGISWKKILELLPKQNEESVTFVAKNQYICNESVANLNKYGAFLAFQKSGSIVSPTFGGPIKLMFENQHTAGAYCWYVDTIFRGEPQKPTLRIHNMGTEQALTMSALEKLPSKTITRNFPLPRGHRFSNNIPASNPEIEGILLTEFVKSRTKPFSKILLKSEVGRDMILIDAKKTDEIMIAYRVNKKQIPVSWGGPFVALSLQGNQISSKLNAQFFLNQISIEEGESQK